MDPSKGEVPPAGRCRARGPWPPAALGSCRQCASPLDSGPAPAQPYSPTRPVVRVAGRGGARDVILSSIGGDPAQPGLVRHGGRTAPVPCVPALMAPSGRRFAPPSTTARTRPGCCAKRPRSGGARGSPQWCAAGRGVPPCRADQPLRAAAKASSTPRPSGQPSMLVHHALDTGRSGSANGTSRPMAVRLTAPPTTTDAESGAPAVPLLRGDQASCDADATAAKAAG
jgi:hypothetical protein